MEHLRQGVDAGTSGTLYIDNFESRRFSYIGLLPEPDVDIAQPALPTGWAKRQYAYDPAHPHAVSAVTGAVTGSYTYDDNGNMTCRIEGSGANRVAYIQEYNAENRLSAITRIPGEDCESTSRVNAVEWLFGYDGDGARVSTGVIQYDAAGAAGPLQLTAYFMGGAYEVQPTGAVRKYYSIAGQMVAVREIDNSTQPATSSLSYLLTDHLGSVVAVTNAEGTQATQKRYMPFGELRAITPFAQTDFGYTSQRSLPGTGLLDYKARLYSPSLMRFIQPDTIVPDPANPQAWNRFSYVKNSPIGYNDPTGHSWEDCGQRTGYRCKIHMKQVGKARIFEENEFIPYKELSRLRAIALFAWGECSAGKTYRECWYEQKLMVFEDGQQIDENQLMDLMMGVYYDLKKQSLGLPLSKGDNDWYRGTYDTSIWNGKDAYGPKSDQIVCLGPNCYRRSDINYFAQGMWAAAANETQEEAVADAAKWKHDKYSESLSPKTEFWIRYGYNTYLALDEIFGDLIVNGDFDKYYNH